MDSTGKCMYFSMPLGKLGMAWNTCRVGTSDWTPMHSAVASNDVDRVDELLDANFPVNYVDSRQRTPCMLAVELNSLDVLKKLVIRGGDTSIRGVMHMNALDLATFIGNEHALQVCLNSGAHCRETYCTHEPSWSALVLATMANSPRCADIICDHAWLLKCKHLRATYPVQIACSMGHHEVMEVLVKYPKLTDQGRVPCDVEPPYFYALRAHPFDVGHSRCFSIAFGARAQGQSLVGTSGDHILCEAVKLDRIDCVEIVLQDVRASSDMARAAKDAFGPNPRPSTISTRMWDRLFQNMKIKHTKSSVMVQEFLLKLLPDSVYDRLVAWMEGPSQCDCQSIADARWDCECAYKSTTDQIPENVEDTSGDRKKEGERDQRGRGESGEGTAGDGCLMPTSDDSSNCAGGLLEGKSLRGTRDASETPRRWRTCPAIREHCSRSRSPICWNRSSPSQRRCGSHSHCPGYDGELMDTWLEDTHKDKARWNGSAHGDPGEGNGSKVGPDEHSESIAISPTVDSSDNQLQAVLVPKSATLEGDSCASPSEKACIRSCDPDGSSVKTDATSQYYDCVDTDFPTRVAASHRRDEGVPVTAVKLRDQLDRCTPPREKNTCWLRTSSRRSRDSVRPHRSSSISTRSRCTSKS